MYVVRAWNQVRAGGVALDGKRNPVWWGARYMYGVVGGVGAGDNWYKQYYLGVEFCFGNVGQAYVTS